MAVETECQDMEDASSQVQLKRDFGTQCCFESKFVITATVGAQTDLVCGGFSSTADASVQVEQESPADQLKSVLHDHTYAAQAVDPPDEEKEPSGYSHTDEG